MRKLLKNKSALILFLIIGLTFLVYYKALFNDFIYWDDNLQITNNADIQTWSTQSIKNILTKSYVGMYQPITSLFYFFINNIISKNPFAFHCLSLLIHLINVFLVWLLAKEFFNNKKINLGLAYLFAIHPINVETVAWISALGTLLSSCFSLLAIFFYKKYQIANNQKKYYLVITLSLLAMFSKSSAVVLPIIFILLDYLKNKKITWRDFLTKWPLWFSALGAGIATILARVESQHFPATIEQYSLFDKIIMWFYSYAFYFFKTILPIKLSPFYPFPQKINGYLPLNFYLGALLVIVSTIFFIFNKSAKKLIPLYFWFIVNLILIVRIKPIGTVITADRYNYLAQLSVLILIIIGIERLTKKINYPKAKLINISLIIAISLSFSVITFNQIKSWENNTTVMTTAINIYGDNPESAFLYDNRGNSFAADNKITEAVKDFQTAIYLNPKLANPYNNLGLLTVDYFKNPKQAVKLFDEAISRDFSNSRYHYNKATTLAQYNQAKSALSEFDLAIKLNKQGAPADYYHNRGNAKLALNDFSGAIADFKTAYQTNNNPLSLSMLGLAKFNAGDKSGACQDWSKAAEQKELTAIKNLSNCK